MREDFPRLSRAAFDRVAHRRNDDSWLAEAWGGARVLVLSPKSATPVDPQSLTLALRAAAEVPADLPRRFLGVADGVAYFTVTVEPADADWAGGEWKTLRDIGSAIDDLQAGLVATAVALEQWHQRHGHCPLCGAVTRESNAGWTRTCPEDGSDHFPRTDPAVIMLIHDGGDHALLGRGRDWGAGRFSTLAGFVEPGESLESAVAREVFEEVGVHIEDIRYTASQPWPFPSSLMLGFSARVQGDPGIHLDPTEMAEAGWFSREEVRRAAHWVDTGTSPDPSARVQAISPRLSISRFLIDCWLADELP